MRLRRELGDEERTALPMKPEHQGIWRETNLTPSQWARVPSTASPWRCPPPDASTDAHWQTAEEVSLVLHLLLFSALTPRQRQILNLYYFESRTQQEVAAILGISQAAVSQHLKGQRRGNHYVGGAFRKIRKAIHRAANRYDTADRRRGEILKAFDALLDSSLTRRRARTILDSLASTYRPPS